MSGTTAAVASGSDRSPLTEEECAQLQSYWSACNYLTLGMLYLRSNPLLRAPLGKEDIKARLLGHWGSAPGQSFLWVHLNRVIKKFNLNIVYISGPGHGAAAVLANAYLEGTYSELYPATSRDAAGMQRLFKAFSFPGGLGSHCTPEIPGSIHEGGELGYSVSHAFGAAFDNPDLIVVPVIGDGEAETGPLLASLNSNKFLNPISDGAVLPVLHLNGYKIANPTILARIPEDELRCLLRGFGWDPVVVEADDPSAAHQLMAAALDGCVNEIRAIQRLARSAGLSDRPRWPLLVLRTPKGWTAPKMLDGHRLEGSWRAHQIPIEDVTANAPHLALLEKWMRSYRPDSLFDEGGRLAPALETLAPRGVHRMSANPHANGGALRVPLRLPDVATYAVAVPAPGSVLAAPTYRLGEYLRDVARANPNNFRVFGPDETASNRLQAIYAATKKTWLAERLPEDDDGGELSPSGHVMEILSEHTLEGWAEGYVLTGRHVLLSSYEAFVHIVDSMINQHAKWIEQAQSEVGWRAPVPSLNWLITSTVWRQDHNGFTHQDPGFLDIVTNKRATVTRIYLPPDVNCLLTLMARCLNTTDLINVVVADKRDHLQYLDLGAARKHCQAGLGVWEWASTSDLSEAEVVIASAGDVPTMEALAAVAILKAAVPDLRLRFVNVVDLFTVQAADQHPHGLTDPQFDALFGRNLPVIFNFHGYPALIHKLAYRHGCGENLHVHGYREKGGISTPLELAIRNEIDRFSLALDVIKHVPRLRTSSFDSLRSRLIEQIRASVAHAHEYGEDAPKIRDWKWPELSI